MLVLDAALQYSCIVLHYFYLFNSRTEFNFIYQFHILSKTIITRNTKPSKAWNFNSPPPFYFLLSHSLLVWTHRFNNTVVCYQPNSDGLVHLSACIWDCVEWQGVLAICHSQFHCRAFVWGSEKKVLHSPCTALPLQARQIHSQPLPPISWHKCHSEAFPLK